MICIYRALGPTDAYMVRDWLERNHLRAWVRGEALMTAIGQVPVAESWPSVWVLEADEAAATAAVRAFEGPKLVHPEWRCSCGELNPATFGSCWSCGGEPG